MQAVPSLELAELVKANQSEREKFEDMSQEERELLFKHDLIRRKRVR